MTATPCDACENVFAGYTPIKLIDGKYTYNLCDNCLIPFVGRCLPPELWKVLIKKFPDSFYLHDDFYDAEGNPLQESYHNHLVLIGQNEDKQNGTKIN